MAVALGAATAAAWVFYWIGFTAGQRHERLHRRPLGAYVDTLKKRGAR